MNQIARSTQIFFHDGNNSSAVTVSSRCEKCNKIVNHACPFGRRVLCHSELDADMETSKMAFECKICSQVVGHAC